MRSYLYYLKLECMTNLQYRMDALAGILTQIFFAIIFIMVYLAFYESNSSTTPMSWQELVNYIYLQQAFYALIFPYTKDKELLKIIKNGNIAYELIRPQNFYIKCYIRIFSKKLIASLLRFSPIIIIASILPYPFHLSLPVSLSNFLIFILSLFLSCLLITSLTVIVHILTMFTLDEKGLIGIYAAVAEVFMGGVVPIPFFPKFMQDIAYILPFRFISDFPFRIYSGSINIQEGITMLMGSSIWIIITIFLGVVITNISLKKVVVQGG